MSTIKIEITGDDKDGVVLNVLRLLSGNASVENIEVKDAEEATTVKAPTKKAATPKAPAKKPEPVEVEEPETGDDEEDFAAEETDDEDGITEEDLKVLLAKKVTSNRDAIVKKMKSLDAARVSEIKPEDYQVFYDFLSKLK